MNSKLIKASLAGAAALALVAGGSTMAAFSDFNIGGQNTVGAGVLTLHVEGNTPADVPFNQVHMAPGGINQVRNVYVASNDLASTPSGRLFVSLVDLHGHEDGCDGNAEVLDDPNCATTADSNPGQFVRDSILQFVSWAANSPSDCVPPASGAQAAKLVTPQHGGSLTAVAAWATPWELTGDGRSLGGVDRHYLAPGQGMCVSLDLSLAYATNNASQGDSADFKVRFDLQQAPYGTPTTPIVP
jgi:hypothetical protein